MKARDYKPFAPETYYHVYSRGNGKQDIFFHPDDYNFFLYRLRENLYPELAEPFFQKKQDAGRTREVRRSLLPKNSFELVSYCLMPNHFHFLVKQSGDTPVSALMLKLLTSYSKYFNKKYDHAGHVFQDRFRAVVVDSNEYLLWLSAYIHQNPKTGKIVKDLKKYPWSSYNEYIGDVQNQICKKDIISSQFQTESEYKDFVNTSFEAIMEKKEEIDHLLLDADLHYTTWK